MAAVISRQLNSKEKASRAMAQGLNSKDHQSKLLAAPAHLTPSTSHASSSPSNSSHSAFAHSSQNPIGRRDVPTKNAGPGPPGGGGRPSRTDVGQVKDIHLTRQNAPSNANLEPKSVITTNRLSGGSFNAESSRSTTPNPSTSPLLSSKPDPPVSGGPHSGRPIGSTSLKTPALNAGHRTIELTGSTTSARVRNGSIEPDLETEAVERDVDDDDEPSKLVTRIVAGVAIALVAAAVVLVAIMLKLSAHLDSKGIKVDAFFSDFN